MFRLAEEKEENEEKEETEENEASEEKEKEEDKSIRLSLAILYHRLTIA